MAEHAETIRTLIVDDEPLAIERMQLLCAATPAVSLVGTANDGATALRLAEALQPDLILLDIAMPGEDGMSVARKLGEAHRAAGSRPPAIIFVTAFENFALEAFDVAATDYLLKPVAPERLARAIERVTQLRLAPDSQAPAEDARYAQEFWIPNRSELVRIAAADIERVDAERDYMRLRVGDRSYLLHQTITALENRLDPAHFIRLHRSVIVRRDLIRSLSHDKAGAWYAELSNGGQVRIGRTFLAAAKAMVRR